MSHRTARLLEPLLRFLFPGSGRHRRAATTPARGRHTPAYVHGRTARRAGSRPLRGEDNAMVRPYLLAHERRGEARRRPVRRRDLWLAVQGVDIDPRIIHGVAVTA